MNRFLHEILAPKIWMDLYMCIKHRCQHIFCQLKTCEILLLCFFFYCAAYSTENINNADRFFLHCHIVQFFDSCQLTTRIVSGGDFSKKKLGAGAWAREIMFQRVYICPDLLNLHKDFSICGSHAVCISVFILPSRHAS